MRFPQILLSFFLLFICGNLWAAGIYELELLENVAIYQRPDKSSKIIGRARLGQKLPTESRPRRGFYKVQFRSRGKVRSGYVALDEAGYSVIREIKKSLRSRYAVGVSAIYSLQSQGARELETSHDTKYDITEFKGSSTFFRLYVDMPVSTDWASRLGLVMRKTSVEGDAILSGSATYSRFHLEQSFIGIEGVLKRYLLNDYFWMGGVAEFSKGTKVGLKVISGTPVSQSEVKKPFFAVFSVAAGYDIPLVRSGNSALFITPEMRLGGVVTTDPITYLVELAVNVGWAF